MYPVYSLFPCTPPDSTNASLTFSFPSLKPWRYLFPFCFSFSCTHLFLPGLSSGWCCFFLWWTKGWFPWCFLPFLWLGSSQFASLSGLLPFTWLFSFNFFTFSLVRPCSFLLCFRRSFLLSLLISIFAFPLMSCSRLSAAICYPQSIFSAPNSALTTGYLLLILHTLISDLFDFLYFVLLVLYFFYVPFLMEFQYADAVHYCRVMILGFFQFPESLKVGDFIGLSLDVVMGGGYFFWRHRSLGWKMGRIIE